MVCCNVSGGWSEVLGINCNQEEKTLSKLRSQKKCIYIGKTNDYVLGLESSVTQHYCCFNDILDTTIQTACQEQLRHSFGVAASYRCKGITVKDLKKLDFQKINWQDFRDETRKKLEKFQKIDTGNKKNKEKNINFDTWKTNQQKSFLKRDQKSFIPKADRDITTRTEKLKEQMLKNQHEKITNEFINKDYLK